MRLELAIALLGVVTAVGTSAWALLSRRALSLRAEAQARACHELRGPITAARLGLQLMMRTADRSGTTLRALDLELSRAALALDDLAAARAPEDGPRGAEAVDVAALLEDCIESSRVGSGQADADVRLSWRGGRGYVRGDRVRLAQATRNLIANAVEHGGGRVDVHARVDAGIVRIEVTDSGRGLPAPVAELVRRPRRGHGTRGRGLAIAGGIAADHGGRLAAAPSDRGARLVLELPAAAGESPADRGTSPL